MLTALVGGVWALLTIVARQFETRQQEREARQGEQFSTLHEHIQTIQKQMQTTTLDTTRLELKLSESEKATMRDYALKRDLETLQRAFDVRAESILSEVRGMSQRLDEWLKTIAGYMDRKSDKSNDGNH